MSNPEFPLQQMCYQHNLRTFTLHKSSLTEAAHSASRVQEKEMAPEDIKLAPFIVKSEPNTPVFATNSSPREAPQEWFAAIIHREKIAIMTIEYIPAMLAENSKDHSTSSPTKYFSPQLLPLLDRMKIHFSRAMAMARHEAENGVFEWQGSSIKKPKSEPKEPVLPCDVMSSLQMEALLAGIEEVRDPERDDRVIYRRYWRLLAAPGGKESTFGAVIGATSTNELHLKKSMKTKLKKHWDETPKVLIAEFEVDPEGRSIAGRMLQDNRLD